EERDANDSDRVRGDRRSRRGRVSGQPRPSRRQSDGYNANDLGDEREASRDPARRRPVHVPRVRTVEPRQLRASARTQADGNRGRPAATDVPPSRVSAPGGPRWGGCGIDLPDPIIFTHLRRTADLLAATRLPAISLFTEFPKVGGLIGYAPSLPEE